jgi:hypothetical protein
MQRNRVRSWKKGVYDVEFSSRRDRMTAIVANTMSSYRTLRGLVVVRSVRIIVHKEKIGCE